MRKQKEMFERVVQWQQSGVSQKVWCEQNSMAYATFQYWYKRFRSAAQDQPADDFVPLMIDASLSNVWCEVIGVNGTKLVFHQPVSAEFLHSLLN
jgi:hypothetical protein